MKMQSTELTPNGIAWAIFTYYFLHLLSSLLNLISNTKVLSVMQQHYFESKYEKLCLIGKGKMGTIYKVRHIHTNSIYAAKYISLSAVDLLSAKREMKILEALKHMYIIHYYEQFFENNELIIITEYCSGKDLAYHIQQMKDKKQHFNENLVSTWLFQLIMAIDYIHSKNIIHRDLKPHNIFVDEDMNLKIGDFGVSKLLEGTEHCKTIAGSPLYFSPELINDEPYSKKTDIWSLGCIIYELCCLEVPVDITEAPFKPTKGMMQLFELIKDKQPKSLPSAYSRDLNKLVSLMLTKDHKKRPTAQQLYQNPILVNLLINYSSHVNLKEQYSSHAMEKPTLTDSFLDEKSQAMNVRLQQIEDEVKVKIQSYRNKKIKKKEIQINYEEIQAKMRELEKVVKVAFEELRCKVEEDLSDSMKGHSQLQSDGQAVKMGQTSKNQSGMLSSGLSDSGETIFSVKLDDYSQENQMKPSQNQKGEQQSVDSVQSILLQSKSDLSKSITRKDLSFGNTLKSMNLSSNMDKTLQSQYMRTGGQAVTNAEGGSDIFNLTDRTIERLEQIEKQVINNPSILLDETFLTNTLSLSGNNRNLLSFSTSKKTGKNMDHEHSHQGQSLNFDLSKKSLSDSLGKPCKEDGNLGRKPKEQLEDSLEEYEEDFQSFEDDNSDMRDKQMEIVKNLFSNTYKQITMMRNSKGTKESECDGLDLKSKYLPSMSEIKEGSYQGGSTISRHDDFD